MKKTVTRKEMQPRWAALLEKIAHRKDELEYIESLLDFAAFVHSITRWDDGIDRLGSFGTEIGLSDAEKTDLILYEYDRIRKRKKP